MAHDGQVLQDIVVDSGDANSGVNNTAESTAAGNGSKPATTTASISVDAEEFKNTRLAIGTLGKNILEISLSDNLTSTRHIDIRVRRNNRPQSGGGVAVAPLAAGQAVGPGNEAPQDQAPPPAAAQSRRLKIKITVEADDEPEHKPDADAQYLEQMRGWLMTVAALFVGIAFQAAIQPPQWVAEALQDVVLPPRLEHGSNTWPASGPAAAPSPDAAHQRAAAKYQRAGMYQTSNGIALATAMFLLIVLVLVQGTSNARFVTSIVRVAMPTLFINFVLTFLMALSSDWLFTVIYFFLYVWLLPPL